MPKLSPKAMEARRDRILSAAEHCFAQAGYQATSIPDICRGAGISVGALYVHFESKESIVEALAQRSLSAKDAAFEGLPKGAALKDASYLLKLLDALCDEGGPALAQLDLNLWSEATRNARLRVLSESAVGSMRQQLVKLVRESQRTGRLNPNLAPRAVAHLLISLMMGFEVQLALGITLSHKDARRAFSALLEGHWDARPEAP